MPKTNSHINHVPPHASHPAPMPVGLLLGALGALVLLVVLLGRSGGSTPKGKLDPKQLDKARKRYVAAIDKRLAGKVEQYSVLLETRNLVTGFYEQKGQIVGVRFAAKQAHCKRCKALDGKEFSLLDPEKLAAHTPPLHGEVRRGVYCVATFVPVRAEAERPRVTKARA